MAAFKINVDVSEVRNSATKLESRKDTLRGHLNNIYNKVRALENTSWSSDASKEIYDAMTAMKVKFDKQDQVIQAFADFLKNQVAAVYEGTEEKATGNASKFRQ